MKDIKVAIIGAGYMAREHILAFRDIPNVSVEGIFSRTRIKAELLAKEFDIEFVCDSITELYEKTYADAVIVAVPVLKTKETVLSALEFPWVQLIEKPIGYNVSEATEILSAFQAAAKVGYAGFNRRFYSSTATVLNDQEINTGKRLICVYDQEDPCAAWEEKRPQEVIDHWMFVNAIHVIDYFRFFGRGEIISVEPVIRWDPKAPLFVAAKLEYSSGDIGMYHAVWGSPGPWAVTVTTQQKRWELRPLEYPSYQMYGSRNLEKVPITQADMDYKAGLHVQAEEMIKAINGQPHSLVTLEDALITMKLIEKIYQ
jgi:predicted dehydrogenase